VWGGRIGPTRSVGVGDEFPGRSALWFLLARDGFGNAVGGGLLPGLLMCAPSKFRPSTQSSPAIGLAVLGRSGRWQLLVAAGFPDHVASGVRTL